MRDDWKRQAGGKFELKIRRASKLVWVQFPPPAPNPHSALPSFLASYDTGPLAEWSAASCRHLLQLGWPRAQGDIKADPVFPLPEFFTVPCQLAVELPASQYKF